MKQLVGREVCDNSMKTKRKSGPAKTHRKEKQLTFDGQLQIKNDRWRRLQKKVRRPKNLSKQSVATRGDKTTVAGSTCPSSFSIVRTNKKFERLRREVQQLKNDCKSFSHLILPEIIELQREDGKGIRKFNCYPDTVMKFPENLRQTIHKAEVDFDVNSKNDQIKQSMQYMINQLRQAIKLNRQANFNK